MAFFQGVMNIGQIGEMILTSIFRAPSRAGGDTVT